MLIRWVTLSTPPDVPDNDNSDYDDDEYLSYEVINTLEWRREGLDILPESLVDVSPSWSHVLTLLRQVRNVLSQ